MTPLAAPARDPWTRIAGLIAGRAVAEASIALLPLVAGSIAAAYRVSPAQVGYLVAVQLGGMAAAAMGAAPLFPRLRPRLALAVGLLAIGLGDLASSQAGSLTMLYAARLSTGVGEGLVAAMVNGLATRSAQPRKLFTLMTSGSAAFGLMVFVFALVVPGGVAAVGAGRMFMGLVILVAALSPLVLMAPPGPRGPMVEAREAGPAPLSAIGLPGLCLLLSWGVFQVGQNGLWAYVEQIGVQAGLPLGVIVRGLLIMSASALLAASLSTLAPARIGNLIPITAMIALSSCSSIALGQAHTELQFVLSGAAMSVALYLAMPFVFALAADLDPSGRIAAAVPGFVAVGSAIGPACAAIALDASGGYAGVANFAAISVLASFVIILPAAAAARHNARLAEGA